MKPLPFTPIFIIGAPRSGTNLLRDLITSSPEFITWPCDEINGIWRWGNLTKNTDELQLVDCTPRVQKYIRRQFEKLWSSRAEEGSLYIVEKTCANSLRVEFIKKIFPEAKFIFLFREASAAVRSATKRWDGEFELKMSRYLHQKWKYTPGSAKLVLALQFFRSRLVNSLSYKEPLRYWGPLIKSLSDSAGLTSSEKASRQWCCCVEATLESLSSISHKNKSYISYQNLTLDSLGEVTRALNNLDLEYDMNLLKRGVSDIKINKIRRFTRLPVDLSYITKDRILRNEKAITELFSKDAG
jgi:hypothetical protein